MRLKTGRTPSPCRIILTCASDLPAKHAKPVIGKAHRLEATEQARTLRQTEAAHLAFPFRQWRGSARGTSGRSLQEGVDFRVGCMPRRMGLRAPLSRRLRRRAPQPLRLDGIAGPSPLPETLRSRSPSSPAGRSQAEAQRSCRPLGERERPIAMGPRRPDSSRWSSVRSAPGISRRRKRGGILGDDVNRIVARNEAGGGAAGNVLAISSQQGSNGELGPLDLGDREAASPSRPAPRKRENARFISITTNAARLWVDGELHIRSRRVSTPDLAPRPRSKASRHDLVFLVREGQSGCDGYWKSAGNESPIGSIFSMEQIMMQLSALSRTTSISKSFQPNQALLDQHLARG